MNQPFFSIVMPVYKVEKYLEEAVSSVLNQSSDDFELLLIDDCSPDQSPLICDRMASEEPRIQVIHLEKNGGVSNARNIGMDHASGRYLFFMDSDDFIEPGLFDAARKSLLENPAPIVFFGMTEDHYDPQGRCVESLPVVLPTQYFKDKESLRKYMIRLEKSTLYGYACNKFYDLEYLRNLGLRYKEYALNEDILFNIAFCRDIERMNILGIPAYHYRKNMDNRSRTSQFVKEYFQLHVQKMQALADQYRYWNMYTEDVRCDLAAIYTRYIMSALQRNCDPRSHMTLGKRKRWIKRLYDQQLFKELIPYGKPSNPVVKVLHMCLNRHWTFLALVFGRGIYIVKNKMPGIFNAVQKNR